MATKRIQDLENVEKVLADSIIPVGEATKTKSMLISQLKNWLSSFFVSKSGDEEISGKKIFLDGFEIRGNNEPYLLLHIPGVYFGRLAMTPQGMASKRGDGSALQQFYAGASAAINTVITTQGINKAANGYVKLGNGIIIQWGQIGANGGKRRTVTLPTSFSSTNYTVCSSNTTYADGAPWGATIEQTTTTTFKIFQVHQQKIWWLAIGY